MIPLPSRMRAEKVTPHLVCAIAWKMVVGQFDRNPAGFNSHKRTQRKKLLRPLRSFEAISRCHPLRLGQPRYENYDWTHNLS